MTPLSPTALEAAAVEIYAQEYDREAYPLAKQDPEIKKLLHAQATAAITAYLAQMKREGLEMTPAATADLLRFVIDHYANQDMNHADFRVYAYQIAQRIVEPTDASN